MLQPIRQFVVCFAVVIVATMQAYGVANAQHRIEHALEFPGVAYAQTVVEQHGHDHDEAGHDDPAPASDIVTAQADTDTDHQPVNHHHHASGDLSIALATASYRIDGGYSRARHLGPAPDRLPVGASRDGPTHPPKQTQMIA